MTNQELEDLSIRIQSLLFKDDIDSLYDFMCDDITWNDERFDHMINGKETLKKELFNKRDSFPYYVEHRYVHLTPMDDSYTICDIMLQCRDKDNTPISSFMMRLSIVFQMHEDHGLMYHVNLSYDNFHVCFDVDEKAQLSQDMQQGLLYEKMDAIDEKSRDLKTLTDNVPGGIFRCRFDETLTILQMSAGFLAMFGYDEKDIKETFHNSFWEMIDPRDRKITLDEVNRQLEKSSTKQIEYRVVCKDGSSIWVLDKGQLMISKENERSFYCILVDINESKKAQETLRLSLERHKIIMAQTNDIIFEWNIDTDSLIISNNWENKFGYTPITKEMSKIFQDAQNNTHIFDEDRKLLIEMMGEIISGKVYQENEIRILDANDSFIWCKIRLTTLFDNNNLPIKAVGVVIDIDQEKKHSQYLLEKAEKDALTGMFNKITAQNLIENYLRSCSEKEICAMMIIDIDNFKHINDTMGHLFGDAILTDIAQVIRSQFRSGDILGRIGGDEFIVFLKELASKENASVLAAKIIEEFKGIHVQEYPEINISCSIGVALFNQHGRSLTDLYQKADQALYQAKKEGKNQYNVYDDNVIHDFISDVSDGFRSAINEKIDSNENNRGVHEKLVEYVFSVLYKSKDINMAVQTILEIVGLQFDVSRAYIFENSFDNRVCNNTFEWCNKGVIPEIDKLQNISYETTLDGYQNNFDQNGIFYCRDIKLLPKSQYDILKTQGIKSMLQCAIRDNGEFRGYVGFDECRSNRYWTQDQIDALSFIAEILSTFLLKRKAQEYAESEKNAMQELLNNQSSWIYVVDPSTFELLYINKATQAIAPHARLGMTCHEAFFHRDTICEHCPARNVNATHIRESLEIYNPYLLVYSATDASYITWKGREAIMLTCHDITKYKK